MFWHGHVLGLTAAHCAEGDAPCEPHKDFLHGRQTPGADSSPLYVAWCGSCFDPDNCDVAVLVPVAPLPGVRPLPLDDDPSFRATLDESVIATGGPYRETNVFSRGYVASNVPRVWRDRGYLLVHGDFAPGSSGSGVYTAASPPGLLGLVVRQSDRRGTAGGLLCETKAACLYALNAWEQGVP